MKRVAVVVDVRGNENFEDMYAEIEKFKQKYKSVSIIFFDAKVDCLIVRYKETRRKHPLSEENLKEEDVVLESAEQEAIASIQHMDLLKKLHLCPEPFREILYLRIFGNLSFKEIGEIMGKTENWARVTFYRGKEKLRKGLMDDEE